MAYFKIGHMDFLTPITNMWLKFDDSLKIVNSSHHRELFGLESVLISIFRGEHALALSPALGGQLLKLPLSRNSAAAVKSSLGKSSEQISAWRRSDFKVSIAMNDGMAKKISATEWSLPISLIAEKGMPKSLILAENLTDARLYKHSADHHRIISNSPYRFSTQLSSGGGGDTPKILQHELDQRDFFIICITDSDRSTPASAINSTSKKCEENVKKSNWVSFHYALKEREAENILPTTLVEDTLSQPNHRESLIKFNNLQDQKYTEAEWAHLDLKQGTLFFKCIGAENFWDRAAKNACTRGQINEECLRAGSCRKVEREKCDCFIALGIGEKFLEHTADYLDSKSAQSSASRTKTAGNSKTWLQIGASVFNWTAATERIRA